MNDLTEQPRFYIGELVDWLDANVLAGEHPEVTVLSPLQWLQWEMIAAPHIGGEDWGYQVQFRDGTQGCEIASLLRRKRNPPNPDAVTEAREVECV